MQLLANQVGGLGPGGGWSHPFVGRETALHALSSARLARVRLVLVEGEAGIGKTRLVDNFAQSVAREGVRVLAGRWPEQELGPFAGFVSPIRQAVRWAPALDIGVIGELARLVPELAADADVVASASHPDSAIERRLLFESVGVLLAGLGPLLLCLDDLHRADASSFALLAHLAEGAGLDALMIVATVRSTDLDATAAARLSEIGRMSALRRIPLTGLEREDIARIVENVAGPMRTDDLVAQVQSAAEGNPFYAEELCEHLLDAPTTLSGRGTGKPDPLPRGVRDLLARRIRSLPAGSRAMVRAGAVLGREFDPVLAGELAGVRDEALIAATEDALLSGLVTESSAATVVFSHALVRAAAEAEVPSVRKVALHRLAAMRLAEAEPRDPEQVADVARHWAAVAAVDGTAAAQAASWAVRAGDLAAAAAATDEAISSYERASELFAVTTAEHADALIRLGTALSSCGRGSEADERFRGAFALAVALDDARLIARAALGLSRHLTFGAVDPERVQALERALGHLDQDERTLRTALEVMLLRQLMFDRSPGGAAHQRELHISVAEALSTDEPPDELLLVVGSARDLVPLIDPHALGRVTTRIVAVAAERHDLAVTANGWWMNAWSALERADRDAWDVSLRAYDTAAKELALPAELATAAAMRACGAQVEGRTAEAHAESAQALAHGGEAGDLSAGSLHLARAVLIGLDENAAEDLLPAMVALAGDYAEVATFGAGLCLTAALAGDTQLASRLLAERAAQGLTKLRVDVEWLAVAGFYSHACVVIGDRGHAEALYSLLVKTPATAVRVGPLAGWWGPVDHHLGGLCRLLERLEEARARLERAIRVAESMRSPPFIARGRLELAAVLEAIGDQDSLREAADLRSSATRD
jgi:tetratricopeptide (TPR) repeat protein